MEFQEYTKKSSDNRSVWHHFLRSINGLQAKCKQCQRVFKISGSTSTLHNHLRNVHHISFKTMESKSQDVEPEPEQSTSGQSHSRTSAPQPKKQKISDFFKSEDSLEIVISRMVTLDGMSLALFCNSVDLRRLFKKTYGKDLPKSSNTIREIVLTVFEKEKTALSKEIKNLKLENCKFAITFDEWTSNKNRRYMNLNLHCHSYADGSTVKSLGLIRIVGSMPAEACVSLIKARLKLFGLTLEKDIIGMTTDGASVMVKVGRISHILHHQLCHAHGIHLAVLDVIYKQRSLVHQESNHPETEIDDSTSTHSEGSDSGSEENDEGLIIQHTGRPGQIHDDFKIVIDKVRSVAHKFKISPTKNDEQLQKYVQAEFGKELQLLQDCKTRWSSLATMVERFLKLKSCVRKALIDIRSSISFSEDEIAVLENLQSSLDVIKTTVEVLCRSDATLLTADTALKLMIKTLSSREDSIAKKFTLALKQRIVQRRLHSLTGTLLYLHNPQQFLNETPDPTFDDTFKKPTLQEIKDIICNIALLDDDSEDTTSVNRPDISLDTASAASGEKQSFSFKDELSRQLALVSSSAMDVSKVQHEHMHTDLPALTLTLTHVGMEMALYENGGCRGEILTKVYKKLLSIPPTSVESERAFSAAGILCNRLRTRLNDDTLDAFMFLRSFFLKKRVV